MSDAVGGLHDRALGLLRQAVGPAAQFRPDQWEAIRAIVEERRRVLLVQRTGWGKSAVYFISTRLLRDQGGGPAVIVSPLLVLMRNQVQMAERLGVNSATVNSTNREDWEPIFDAIRAGAIDLLLISPERLNNPQFRSQVLPDLLRNLGLLVVDEVHCISDWGHDFRPDYRRIVGVLRALPPNVPVLAVTATANDRVVNDVAAQLGALSVVRGPLMRETLALQNIWLPSPVARMAWLAEQLKNLPGSGIIYTLTVRDSERVTEWLKQNGYDVEAYHAKIDSNVDAQDSDGERMRREDLETRLLNNDVKALVATVAL
ncbi:MAG TPA: DEAD/DEAH box helicase, partial [Actinomycetes bacterium]|nr:DEAD/DEAH box helicase [Actinomycetes bacterium]